FRFKEGIEPFSEHCYLHLGMFASMPRLFGYGDARISYESCQCTGATWCQARLSWESDDEATARISRAELRARLSHARLEELQHTVAELVSGDSPTNRAHQGGEGGSAGRAHALHCHRCRAQCQR